MKTLPSLLLLIPLATGLTACDDFSPAALQQQGQGELRWTLDRQSYTKAPEELPDTNDFLLSVTDANGEVLYEGSYGDSPESLLLSPGNYTVSIVSIPFTSPAFARPQYGDTQVAVIRSGESVTVRLHCTLRNAGIRLNIAPDFLTSFPDGILYVKQDDVKLKYQYNERRIAYLKPGEMSLLLYNYGEFETLFTQTPQRIGIQGRTPLEGTTPATRPLRRGMPTEPFRSERLPPISGRKCGCTAISWAET